MKFVHLVTLAVLLTSSAAALADPVPVSQRSDSVRARVVPGLAEELGKAGLKMGSAVFIRIFKTEKELEVWLKDGDQYRLFKTFDICTWSGRLGPKLAEGDGQSPEGFYRVAPEQMNPASRYHLSFNLGFPNAFDRANGRTGSFLMVHGSCVSIGCYAMKNFGIEKIYVLAEAALNNGQAGFDVHIFPFRMTDEAMKKIDGENWEEFWQNLKQGHDLFEASRVPPAVSVSGRLYGFSQPLAMSSSTAPGR